MGLISKITGHSSSNSDSTTAHDNKVASGSSQPNTLDNRTGTSTSSNANPLQGAGKTEHTVQHAAPLTAEHVHDRTTHVDRTKVDEVHEGTQVAQTVQPIRDEQTRRTEHGRVDHGTEVHEHGRAGLDKNAEAELARKREQIAKEHRSTHDEETRQASARPDVDVHQRKNVVEEVVPVVEKDIYRPHEIVHDKHKVEVYNEKPTFEGTRTAKPISVNEYEQKSGVKVHDFDRSDDPTKSTFTTTQHSHGGKQQIGHNGPVEEGLYENQKSSDGQNIGSSNNYAK
jgi:hypothetical protein